MCVIKEIVVKPIREIILYLKLLWRSIASDEDVEDDEEEDEDNNNNNNNNNNNFI